MLVRLNAAKRMFLQRKQSIDWEIIGRDWADYFRNEAPDNWREEFMPLVRGTTVDVNDMWTRELGIQFNVRNLLESAALEFQLYALRFSEPILSTTETDLFQLLKTASEEGWTIEQMNNAIRVLWEKYLDPEKELNDIQRAWFTERQPQYRIERIARTETMKSANFSSQLLFTAYGADRSEWVTAADDRVRPTHRAANGQTQVIGQPFEVGASLMLHPLDGSLGADAGEMVNCRCVTVPVLPEE